MADAEFEKKIIVITILVQVYIRLTLVYFNECTQMRFEE